MGASISTDELLADRKEVLTHWCIPAKGISTYGDFSAIIVNFMETFIPCGVLILSDMSAKQHKLRNVWPSYQLAYGSAYAHET